MSSVVTLRRTKYATRSLKWTCIFVYDNSARMFSQSPFPSEKEQRTLRHTREAHLNATDQWMKVWAEAVWERLLWCDWAERRARDARAHIKGDLRSCHAGRRNCWRDQPDRQSLHDTAHITRISSTKSPRTRPRHKGNPLLLPFIKAPVSFSERCRQGPDFCCSPCSSPPRMNWIRTNPTRPGEHASPTTAPVSRKRSGIMSRLCADTHASGSLGVG